MPRFQDTGSDLPTLLEYYLQGYRHLRVSCLHSCCTYGGTIEIARYLLTKPNKPVNKLGWACKDGHGSTRVHIAPVTGTQCERCAQDWMVRQW